MTPEQASAILDVVKRAETDRSERRIADLEAHLDASDRVIAQAAQLKLMNEGDGGLSAVTAALMEAAKSADPL